MSSNTIDNPFRRGQTITVPAGEILTSTHPRKDGPYLLKRATTVKIHQVFPGWVDTFNDHKQGRGFVVLPAVSWAGSGGYWVDLKITPELCAALGVPVPDLPDAAALRDHGGLDVEPGYGLGYDNRHAPLTTPERTPA